MALKVGISGSYGGFNLGDEAILQCIVAELRQALDVELTVFSRDHRDTRARHDVEHVVQRQDLSRTEAQRIVSDLDLLVLGGGGILYDSDAEMYLREVNLAHEVGTPVMVYAVGAGPLLDRRMRARVRDALEPARAITVRDRHTRQLLEEIGVSREIVLTADPAFLLRPDPLTLEEILRAEAIDPDATLIGFCVREPGPAAPNLSVEHYHRLLANAADFMIARLDAEVVFVPMERRMFDVQHSHGVVGQMNHAQRATVLKRNYSPGQILSLLDHFAFSVGMRLHFLMFSALSGVPFLGLPYASKVAGFLEEFGMQAASLEHVSAGQLLADIDRAWDLRDSLRQQIKVCLPGLKERARRNGEIVVSLLSGTSSEMLGAEQEVSFRR